MDLDISNEGFATIQIFEISIWYSKPLQRNFYVINLWEKPKTSLKFLSQIQKHTPDPAKAQDGTLCENNKQLINMNFDVIAGKFPKKLKFVVQGKFLIILNAHANKKSTLKTGNHAHKKL